MKKCLLNILTYISLPVVIILYPIYYIINYFFITKYYSYYFRFDEDCNKLLFIDTDYSFKSGRFIYVYLEKGIGDGFYKRFNKTLKFKKLGFWNNQRKLKGKLIIFKDLELNDEEVRIGLLTSILSKKEVYINITPGLHFKRNVNDHHYYYPLKNIDILGYYEKY